jgi:DNA processing protein
VPARTGGPRGWPAGFGAGPAERRALVAIASLRGITPLAIHALAWEVGSATACLAAIRRGRAGSNGDRAHLESLRVDDLLQRVEACGARLVAPGGPEYLERLLDLADPPAALFLRGRELRVDAERIAVVGARNSSALGDEVAFDVGRALGGAGVWVVSGAARGIDSAAHRGALAADGRTVAVLGSGIDRWYPRGSAALLHRVLEQGTVVSEYAPGVVPEPFRFPARNRLIAGIASALVVVEGAKGSGSMISVDHALEIGRDVYAVPGPVTSPLAEVPLALIREGAAMIRGGDDLLHDLGIAERLVQAPPPGLPQEEARVLAAVGPGALPDAVARGAGLSIPEAVEILIRLELRGLVRGVGGRYEPTFAAASQAGGAAAST